MKKVTWMMIAILAVIMLVVGCGRKAGPPADPSNIKFITHTNFFNHTNWFRETAWETNTVATWKTNFVNHTNWFTVTETNTVTNTMSATNANVASSVVVATPTTTTKALDTTALIIQAFGRNAGSNTCLQLVSLNHSDNDPRTRSASFDTNAWTGMIGGVPCLFDNKLNDQATVLVGARNGDTFTLELDQSPSKRVYNILPGEYTYSYWTDKDATPKDGGQLEVHKNPCQTIDGQGSYHAVVVIGQPKLN